MSVAAVLVAAGRGERAGGGIPKQYRPVAGIPILERSLNALLAHQGIDRVIPVIHPDDHAHYDTIAARVSDNRLAVPVHGGSTRAESVQASLTALTTEEPTKVLIHDAARPFLSLAVIDRLIEALDRFDGAFPAIPVADALWRQDDGLIPVERDHLLRAQTPQAFRFEKIVEAHRMGDADATDDVAVALAAGLSVTPVAGEEANFKITHPEDFEKADRMAAPPPDIRTGIGYDVHAFEPGSSVTLCGVEIPHDRRLKGHSDADVAMHALTDAIYGALAEGDIGQWFPPSEAEWKGARSSLFLEHAMGRVADRGFRVSNFDVVIVAERPKIGPHAQAMRLRLAEITGVSMDRISVKATTSERLGFVGREEGIAAEAVATLVGT